MRLLLSSYLIWRHGIVVGQPTTVKRILVIGHLLFEHISWHPTPRPESFPILPLRRPFPSLTFIYSIHSFMANCDCYSSGFFTVCVIVIRLCFRRHNVHTYKCIRAVRWYHFIGIYCSLPFVRICSLASHSIDMIFARRHWFTIANQHPAAGQPAMDVFNCLFTNHN